MSVAARTHITALRTVSTFCLPQPSLGRVGVDKMWKPSWSKCIASFRKSLASHITPVQIWTNSVYTFCLPQALAKRPGVDTKWKPILVSSCALLSVKAARVEAWVSPGGIGQRNIYSVCGGRALVHGRPTRQPHVFHASAHPRCPGPAHAGASQVTENKSALIICPC